MKPLKTFESINTALKISLPSGEIFAVSDIICESILSCVFNGVIQDVKTHNLATLIS